MSLIDSIHGKLFSKSPTEAIVDVGGIRYRIRISIAAYESFPSKGDPVELLTHLHVKEDILDLYGFKDNDERSLFMNLNTISGIGPKSAMNILSGTNPDEFKSKIVAGDVKSLTVIPGIGAKTAKRIIVELKEKFASDWEEKDIFGLMVVEIPSMSREAVNALLWLAYKQSNLIKPLKALEVVETFSGELEEIIGKD